MSALSDEMEISKTTPSLKYFSQKHKYMAAQ